MELVFPSSKYSPSYNAYIEELGDEVRYPFPMGFDHQDFDNWGQSKIKLIATNRLR